MLPHLSTDYIHFYTGLNPVLSRTAVLIGNIIQSHSFTSPHPKKKKKKWHVAPCTGLKNKTDADELKGFAWMHLFLIPESHYTLQVL